MEIRIRTLGGLQVLVDGEERFRLTEQPTRAALLVYLAVEVDVTRDAAQAILWGRLPPDRARHSLNQALYLLRKELGDDWVAAEGSRLRVSDRVQVDAREFEAKAGGASATEALSLYGGHFLEGWHTRGHPEFEHWADRVRVRLSRMHRELRRSRLAELGKPDQVEAALQVARDWVALDPSEDEAQHALIESLARSGRRAEALEVYGDYEGALAREDLTPLDHTQELMERIRSGEDLSLQELATPLGPPDDVRPSPGAPQETAVDRDRRTPRVPVWLSGTAAGLVLVAAVLLGRGWLPSSAAPPPPDPNRVLVYPLENRTGDPSLEAIGRMTADWVTQGLARADFVEVVPTVEILTPPGTAEPGMAAPEPGDLARNLARQTGSGTLVTGAYYLNGAELEFNLEVLAGPDWELLQTVGPIRGSSEDPVEAVDVVRQRVMVAVALHLDPSVEGMFIRSEMPPSYPAYLAFVEGFWKAVRGDMRGSAADLIRATELSPDFISPLIILGFAFMEGWGDFARADSVARILEASRDRLPRYDRLRVDLLRASIDGDRVGAYRAAKEASRIVPIGSARFASAHFALDLNRPEEVLETLAAWGPDREGIWEFTRYWNVLTQSHHLLEDHRSELREARRVRSRNPAHVDMAWFEVRALAALDRVPELLAVLDESVGHRWNRSLNPGRVMVGAAEELQVHGFESGVAEVLARFHNWHDALSPNERARPDVRFDLGRALYAGERFAEAQAVFARLLDETPGHPEYMRFLGTIAARTGDLHTAETWSRALAELPSDYLFGRHTLGRAAIAARVGDPETALSLLQGAVSQGLTFGTALHADPDLSTLRDLPGYREFMRPRG